MKPIDFRIFRTNWIPDFLPIGSLWLETSATALCGPYVIQYCIYSIYIPYIFEYHCTVIIMPCKNLQMVNWLVGPCGLSASALDSLDPQTSRRVISEVSRCSSLELKLDDLDNQQYLYIFAESTSKHPVVYIKRPLGERILKSSANCFWS